MVDKTFDDRNGSSPYTKLMQEKLISVWEDWVKEGKLLSKIPETNNRLDSRWPVKCICNKKLYPVKKHHSERQANFTSGESAWTHRFFIAIEQIKVAILSV